MAEKQKQVEQTPVPQGSDQGEKPGGILHSIVVILLALLIVAVVTIGVFYFAIKNNINGLGDTVRPQIENHPILKFALPAEPKPSDPDDPEYLTQKELLKKYDEYRTKVEMLNKSLNTANEAINQMKSDAESNTKSETEIKDNQVLLDSIKEEQTKLEAEKKTLSELIAKGDTQGFRDYFQKVDKATAEAIYKEIIIQDAQNENKVELAKPFSIMEPKSAAGVLTQLFEEDQNTLLDIFEGLKPNAAALIFEQMDSKTAAEITKLLSDRKQDR
jgi:flagellar motility protein MotE (MotC chaperone)